MKNLPHKAAIIAGTCAIALAALLPPAAAQSVQKQQNALIDTKARPVKAGGSVTAEVRASVSFIQGVEVKVEHETIDKALPQIDTQNAVTTKATIAINGLPDELALMTCGVETVARSRRDCAGGSNVAQHAIMGNHSLESGILLTNDLLPNPTGQSESSIAIEVTYL